MADLLLRDAEPLDELGQNGDRRRDVDVVAAPQDRVAARDDHLAAADDSADEHAAAAEHFGQAAQADVFKQAVLEHAQLDDLDAPLRKGLAL